MISKLIQVNLDRALKALKIEGIPYVVEPTSDLRFGDWTTNVALKLAKRGGDDRWQKAEAIAKAVVKQLGVLPFAEVVEVAPPGFINIKLSIKWINRELSIISMGDWGDMGDWGKGKRVLIEYVSANPTGPLHIGNARSGPIGDTLGRVLEYAGYHVDREYYVNDIGGQVEKLGESLLALGFPERKTSQPTTAEYTGPFYEELAKKLREELGREQAAEVIAALPEDNLSEILTKKAIKINIACIQKDCEDLGLRFDQWQYESEIARAKTPEMIKFLKNSDATVEKDGALWLKGREKDQDSVLMKQEGTYTYFANDIAYHKDKFDRGYDVVIDVWGSNHHGHVARMEAAIERLGIKRDRFRVILYQYVRVKRGNEVVRMSKRLGTFVTVGEVLDEVGVDAARFFLLSRASETHVDFDLALAIKTSEVNPVYAVQYAHARICSILRKASRKYETNLSHKTNTDFVLDHPAELALGKKLLEFPEVIEEIVEHYTVHSLTQYAQEVSGLFHKMYEQQHVLSVKSAEQAARLTLVRATKNVLERALDLLGISAPERMEKT